jgi:hypothetical protein
VPYIWDLIVLNWMRGDNDKHALVRSGEPTTRINQKNHLLTFQDSVVSFNGIIRPKAKNGSVKRMFHLIFG